MDLICDLVAACYRQIGVEPPPGAVRAVEDEIRYQYGGEARYIARRRRIAALIDEAAGDPRRLAALADITERHARRLIHGK